MGPGIPQAREGGADRGLMGTRGPGLAERSELCSRARRDESISLGLWPCWA